MHNNSIVFIEGNNGSDTSLSARVRDVDSTLTITCHPTLPDITDASIYIIEETFLNKLSGDWTVTGAIKCALIEGNPSNIPVRLDGQPLLIFRIPANASAEVWSQNITSLQTTISTHNQLSNELVEASDIAVLSMRNSSFLGDIIRFMEASAEIQTIQELGESIITLSERLQIKANVRIENDTDQFDYYLDSSLKSRLLKNRNSNHRIIESIETCQINFPYISFLFQYPKEDSGFVDQIKDSLSVLMGELNQRIFNIQLEQDALEAERTKELILATLSHELRTPLHIIHGFSDRLRKKVEGDRLTAREVSGLHSIHEKALLLQSFLDQQLYLFKLLSGSIKSSKEEIKIGHIVNLISDEYGHKCKEKGLEFNFWSDVSDIIIETDRDKLMRAILITLDNAIKFTPKGKIEFSCLLQTHDNEKQVVFKISDTGIGIAPEYIDHIFNPFSQQDMGTSREFGGCGLGLAVASTLMLQLQGTIHVDSTENSGSVFSISLPIPSESNNQSRTEEPPLLDTDVVLF